MQGKCPDCGKFCEKVKYSRSVQEELRDFFEWDTIRCTACNKVFDFFDDSDRYRPRCGIIPPDAIVSMENVPNLARTVNNIPVIMCDPSGHLTLSDYDSKVLVRLKDTEILRVDFCDMHIYSEESVPYWYTPSCPATQAIERVIWSKRRYADALTPPDASSLNKTDSFEILDSVINKRNDDA